MIPPAFPGDRKVGDLPSTFTEVFLDQDFGFVFVDRLHLGTSYCSAGKYCLSRSVPLSPMLRSSSSICFNARGDGLARPFSQRLIVGKVTPSLAANFSWVRPVRSRSLRINRGVPARAFNASLLSDPTRDLKRPDGIAIHLTRLIR